MDHVYKADMKLLIIILLGNYLPFKKVSLSVADEAKLIQE